jgi:N-methylhydantoinase B
MERGTASDRWLDAGAITVTSASFDLLDLQVMAHAFAAVAEEMGTVLVRGALSPNIRERRDSSCALFDGGGAMVAQAAHIPVHLGAMPDAVRAVIARRPNPGDVFLLNDPFAGGSHLPDLTLVEAIGHEGRVAAFTAVRAHHGDVGGMSPGSMPQGATELVQEGLVLPPVRLATQTGIAEDVMSILLANVRTPDERRGDVRAQLGASAAGRAAWRALVAREGTARVEQAGRALIEYSERSARAVVRQLADRVGHAEDALEGDGVSEDDVRVVVAIRQRDGRLVCDFTGSSPQVRGNVNAPPAVARAAAVFVLRTMLDDEIPMNDGIARAVEVIAPRGSVMNPAWPAAVAAGNVELSQRLTDALFAALADAGVKVPAQGQGTMNNVTFGGAGWTFYETLGGGQGATAKGPGPSAVHVGMSNTRNTPIESLEWSLPLRIEEYSIRRKSGGEGAMRGGEGVVRRYRTLERCTVTLLTERRRRSPRGAMGGGPGSPGRNSLNGRWLPAKCRVEMQPGDVLTIETPGGGGYGRAR